MVTKMRRDVFQAIADPTRRKILSLLSREPMSVNRVASEFGTSRPAISRHIRILTECGLILMDKKGRERHCVPQFQKLKQVSDWTEKYRRFWNERLDALEQYMSSEKSGSKDVKKISTKLKHK